MSESVGTYVAFDAEGTADPTKSDQKYYRVLQMWGRNASADFKFVDSHRLVEDLPLDLKIGSRDYISALARRLMACISASRNVVLIIGETTRRNRFWIPFEISFAADNCLLPIIATYPGHDSIVSPCDLRRLWPEALASRIELGLARVIHVPFRKEMIKRALSASLSLTGGGLNYFSITELGELQLLESSDLSLRISMKRTSGRR